MKLNINWGNAMILLGIINIIIVLIMLCFSGCIQHELDYTYYLSEPNSLHVEKFHYKQNVCLAETDKIMTEAAFADVIKVSIDRSVQRPDPNSVKAVTEGVVGVAVGGL